MEITIHQIHNLLSNYQGQESGSWLSDARIRCFGGILEPHEPMVFFSSEARRLQLYEQIVKDVLRRFRNDPHQ